jgi:D-3-phosphoglycerate dehydrogenase / 2-oxoglutarate reductase
LFYNKKRWEASMASGTSPDVTAKGAAASALARPVVFAFERYDPTDTSLDWLEANGVDVIRGHALWEMPFKRFSEAEFLERAQPCVAVMGASGVRITTAVLAALPNLRFISKYGIGVDTIDIDAATAAGVLVSNTPNDFQIFTVSEHAVAMMLALAKQFGTWTPAFMRAGGWRGLTHSATLRGATIGIVGLGRGVAQRLAGWECKILGYDPYLTSPPPGVELVSLAELFARSDFVTLHAAPSAENRHMLNAAAFAAMKPTAYVVNTGRGSLIDYPALRAALAEGRIAGAALDVFDVEPPNVDDPLFQRANVLCTPHVAAWTKEGTEGIGWHAARNLLKMIRGEDGADIVNPEATWRS